MKKLYLFISIFCTGLYSFAQAPQLINYQAVVRNTQGQPVSNTLVNFQFIIHNGTIGGTTVFTETDTATTNKFGLATMQIGGSGALSGVNWGSGNEYLEIGVDISGGSNFTDMGTTQLLSVPYALYAEKSGNKGNWDTTGSAIYNANAGNVGIGTASPAEALEVKGNIRLSNGSARSIYVPDAAAGVNGNNLNLRAGGTPYSGSGAAGGNVNITAGNANSAGHGNAGGNVVITSGGNPWFSSGDNGDIIFQTDSAPGNGYTSPLYERMRIKGNYGYVGIGTSTPSTLLDVEGPYSPAFKLVDGTQGAGNVLTSDSFGNATWQRQSTPAEVAFRATYIDVSQLNASTTYNIVFKSILYDLNGNYNNATGLFTAPVAGIYHFDASMNFGVAANSSFSMGFNSSVVGVFASNSFAVYTGVGLPVSGFTSCDIMLAQNETVGVQVTVSSQSNILDGGSAQAVNFSGHLVH